MHRSTPTSQVERTTMGEHVPSEYDRHKSHDPDEIHGDKGQTGDLCPWCGDPISVKDTLVGPSGESVGMVENWPLRVFHEGCWKEERDAMRADNNKSLFDYE